jgi:hypothetical protein
VGGENSKNARIRQATIDFLHERGPIHRREILAHLTRLSVMGHEADPMKALGSYLSRWPEDIIPKGAGVWRLREHEKGEGA